jgi:ligand-binding sensor domain-containing protein/signal transduction histidine kinase
MIQRLRLFHFLLTCVVLASSGHAQQYPFTRYRTSDGLVQNYITGIVQDYRGFLWTGTGDAGLSRFDGRDFVTFDAFNADVPGVVTTLATDGSSLLFIGSLNGVRCIRLRSDMTDRADSVLNHALERVRGPVREMYMRSARELYIGGPEHAWMFSLNDSTLRLTPVLPLRHAYLRALYPGTDIRGMARGCDKRIWLATDKGLILHDDAGSIRFDRGNGLANDDVLSVYCDNEGNVWAGTVDGLFMHTPDRVINFLPGRELDSDARGVWSILSTREHVLWVGTLGGGLSRLFGGERRTFRTKDGLPSDDVSALLELPNGDILIGTKQGLAVSSGGRITSMSNIIPLPDRRVEALFRSSDGRYWIATHRGLAVWNGAQTRVYTEKDGLPHDRISCIAEDSFGFVWIGTHAGVARINLRSGNVLPVESIGYVHVVCMHIDVRDRVWLGTVGGGVICRNNAGGSVSYFNRDDGLAGNTVYFIAADAHGSLYFGTNNGISVLPAGYIDHLVDDGAMYYGGGIDPVIVKSILRSQSLHTLSTRSGLAGDEMNSGAVYRDSKDRLWFGAIGGLSCFQPQKPPSLTSWSYPDCRGRSEATSRRRIWIDDFHINDTLSSRRGTVELGPNDRVLRLRVLAPAFRNPGSVRFMYKLEGLDYTWHTSTDGRILYTAIPAGTYKLLLRATLGEGHWTPEHVMLSFVVSPPFTDTLWFWLLLLLLTGCLGAAVMYWRSRKQVEMERMRIRIASDLHDDIGASLGTISLLSDLEKRRGASSTSGNLTTIGTLARRCVQDMSDIVWSVNPAHDSVLGLTERLRESADELSMASGISVLVDAAGIRPELRIEAVVRRALMLIAKEALYNAVRHSGAAHIRLSIKKHRQQWTLLVEDDGHGFDTTKAYTGNGVRNMKRRAQSLGWEVDIFSSPGGSTITLHFSL